MSLCLALAAAVLTLGPLQAGRDPASFPYVFLPAARDRSPRGRPDRGVVDAAVLRARGPDDRRVLPAGRRRDVVRGTASLSEVDAAQQVGERHSLAGDLFLRLVHFLARLLRGLL